MSFYLKSSVVLHHNIGKVYPLSTADELSDLWMVVGPDIVAHKVPVDAVSAALLLVQQDVRGWKKQKRRRCGFQNKPDTCRSVVDWFPG